MSTYYYNAAGQRSPLPEQPLAPPPDIPLRYCARCRCEIYHGGDNLCDDCQKEAFRRDQMLDYMKANPGALLGFLEENADRRCLDGFFQAFWQQCDIE